MISKSDIDVALPVLVERAFGQLVVSTSGAPMAVHMPFLVDRKDGDHLRVELHLARMNPILKTLEDGCEVLLMCEGGDGYISPDWYGSDNRVPTWAYESVHLTGMARVLPETENRGHVDRLSAFFEAQLLPKLPWTSAKMDQKKLAAMLKAIVTVSIEITGIVTKKKDLREKNGRERLGAIAGLISRGDDRSEQVAKLITDTLS